MKISFFEINDWEREYVNKKLENHSLSFSSENLNKNNVTVAKDAEAISVFIYSKVNKDILDNLPNLKIITTRSTGFDHIDLEECNRRGIVVCNVPFYGENTVAEHTFALILSLSRNIHKSYLRTLSNDFTIEDLSGFDLKGKIIGIVGGGHIGLHVARIAKGFGMKVYVYDIYKQDFLSEVMGFEYMGLDELLKISDIVSLHTPYNKFTHHIINKDSLLKMKKGAILINTARGGLVDTDALHESLREGHLGGAGLDVLEGEELVREEKQLLYDTEKSDKLKMLMRNKEIFKMDNVVFTPHNAFNSREALLRILDTTLETLSVCSNGKCQFIVNPVKTDKK